MNQQPPPIIAQEPPPSRAPSNLLLPIERGETRSSGELEEEGIQSEDEDEGFSFAGEGEARPAGEQQFSRSEGLFWAAVDRNSLIDARFVLEDAKDCPFYSKARGVLQGRTNLVCMKFENALDPTPKPPPRDTGLLAGDWEQSPYYFVIRISRHGRHYVGRIGEISESKTKRYGYTRGETVLEVDFVKGNKYVGKYKASMYDRRTNRRFNRWVQADVYVNTKYKTFGVYYHNEFSGKKDSEDFHRYKPKSRGKTRFSTGFE